MKVSPARKAAFEILLKIEKEKAYSSVLLPKYAESLSEKDRSLLYALVLGVLRKQLILDRYIKVLTKNKKLDIEVILILRLGLFQFTYMDRIPDHSVVNEAVNLTVKARKTSAKGLVNAVLRNSMRKLPVLSYADDIDRISTKNSVPEWLVKRWIEQFGSERAESIAMSFNDPAHNAFRLTRRSLLDREKVDEITKTVLEYASRSDILPGAFVAPRITSELRQLSEAGLIYFQDIGSQMIAAAVGLRSERSFLDLCAAPGGKTGMVAAQAGVGSEILVAGEINQNRVDFLKRNLMVQGAENVRVVRLNAEEMLPFPKDHFDVILLDAPCSGTGTIRSNPEIRYFLQNEDLFELQRKQRAILDRASYILKRGGRLIYSTCSLEREENEDVISSFLEDNGEFYTVPPSLPDVFVTNEGNGRIFPDFGPFDGFCVFEIRRQN